MDKKSRSTKKRICVFIGEKNVIFTKNLHGVFFSVNMGVCDVYETIKRTLLQWIRENL